MIEFKRMTEDSYRNFVASGVADFAEENVKSGEWDVADAQEKAQKELADLLPNGLETLNHFLFDLVDPSKGERVGVLWFALRGPQERRSVFIYDVRIDPHFQRQGYATQAFEVLKEKVRALGAKSVHLHVFGHNQGARALYESLGFVTTHLMMELDVTSGQSLTLQDTE